LRHIIQFPSGKLPQRYNQSNMFFIDMIIEIFYISKLVETATRLEQGEE